MVRQRHEATLAAPMTDVFSALVQMLARSRWASDERLAGLGRLPRVGQTYVQRRGSVVRRGRVVECLRPVVLTLYESLFDPPCRVRLRMRWRLEPLETGSLVLLDASYELNGLAYLNRHHWRSEIHTHCGKLLRALAARLTDRPHRVYGVCSGQTIGSNSITVTNTTAVNGSPSFK